MYVLYVLKFYMSWSSNFGWEAIQFQSCFTLYKKAIEQGPQSQIAPKAKRGLKKHPRAALWLP